MIFRFAEPTRNTFGSEGHHVAQYGTLPCVTDSAHAPVSVSHSLTDRSYEHERKLHVME